MNDLHSLAYAYAVGLLTPDEARDFERHLVECPDCTSEVVDVRAVASALSTTVAAEPPAGLRVAVLTQIARTPQLPALATVSELPTQVAPRHRDGNVVPFQPTRRRRVAISLLAAAAVLTVVGVGGWAYQASRDDDTNVITNDVAAQQRDALADLLAADDVQTVSGRFPQTQHTGTVVLSEKRQEAMFVSSGLPTLPDNQTYEAWTVDGVATPAGTFTSDGDRSVTTLSNPDAALKADSFAITVEPAGGSDQPTSDAIFTVSLPQR